MRSDMHSTTMNSDSGSLFRSVRLFGKVPLWSALLVGASALLAFFAWTLPNLAEFLHNVAQFPLLWSVDAGNQREIVRLFVTVFSPVILATIVGACCWLWFTIKPYIPTTKSQTALPAQSMTPLQHREDLQSSTDQPLLSPVYAPQTPLPVVYEESEEQSSRLQEDVPQEESRQNSEVEHNQPVLQPAATTRGPGELPYIVIHLLGTVSMEVQTADGSARTSVPIPESALRTHLLAYIASLRGDRIGREKVLEHVFGHGRDDEDASPAKLTAAFDSHRKLLRTDLRAAITKLNEQVGFEAVPPTLDLLANFQKNWWLAETCRVVDLDAVESCHDIILQAEQAGKLASSIPSYVADACESLIAAYPGDFMARLLKEHPEDFDPWSQNWARVPFTRYRDYLLEALWYLAGHEMQLGQALGSQPDEVALLQQNQHYDRAARYYRTYAMRACSSRFDLKVTFSRTERGEHGERVVMSERALRRCLMLYGTIGNTQMVDRVFNEYSKLLQRVSADAWRPNPETQADLEAARSRTSAFRLSTQVASAKVTQESDSSSLESATHS
jgi:hypothetical protein